MKKKMIEPSVTGLKCDNPDCDWVDMSIPVDDYPQYVGAKCPKCGEVILTKTDFKAIKRLLRFVKFLNLFSVFVKDNGERTKMRLASDGNGNINVVSISKEEDTVNE